MRSSLDAASSQAPITTTSGAILGTPDADLPRGHPFAVGAVCGRAGLSFGWIPHAAELIPDWTTHDVPGAQMGHTAWLDWLVGTPTKAGPSSLGTVIPPLIPYAQQGPLRSRGQVEETELGVVSDIARSGKVSLSTYTPSAETTAGCCATTPTPQSSSGPPMRSSPHSAGRPRTPTGCSTPSWKALGGSAGPRSRRCT